LGINIKLLLRCDRLLAVRTLVLHKMYRYCGSGQRSNPITTEHKIVSPPEADRNDGKKQNVQVSDTTDDE
jgi:hypothetical protein